MSLNGEKLDKCPFCDISWIADEIPKGLYDTGQNASMDEARQATKRYGWTEENKKCFKKEIARYCNLEDRVIAYECFSCNKEYSIEQRIQYVYQSSLINII